MRRKRNNLPLLSSDSESQQFLVSQPRSFDSSSSSSSDSSQLVHKERSDAKVSKKDMLKLIKLEKAIEREERILEKEQRVLKYKSQIKSLQKKKIAKKEQKNLSPSASGKVLNEKKKLFITAIQQKYSQEEVDHELSKLLKNIQGLVNFRVKKKQGSSTYAFVDFVSKQKAAEGLQKLKKKRIFGQKITICYSQDDQRQSNRANQTNNGPKKCFQCNGKGHFAKECPLRLKLKKQLKDDEDQNYFLALKASENTNFEQDSDDSEQEFVKYESNAVKLEPEEAPIKRVIREKSGLNRLCQN